MCLSRSLSSFEERERSNIGTLGQRAARSGLEHGCFNSPVRTAISSASSSDCPETTPPPEPPLRTRSVSRLRNPTVYELLLASRPRLNGHRRSAPTRAHPSAHRSPALGVRGLHCRGSSLADATMGSALAVSSFSSVSASSPLVLSGVGSAVLASPSTLFVVRFRLPRTTSTSASMAGIGSGRPPGSSTKNRVSLTILCPLQLRQFRGRPYQNGQSAGAPLSQAPRRRKPAAARPEYCNAS